MRAMKRHRRCGSQLFFGSNVKQVVVPNSVWAMVYGHGYRYAFDQTDATHALPSVGEQFSGIAYWEEIWKEGLADGLQDKVAGAAAPPATETFLSEW